MALALTAALCSGCAALPLRPAPGEESFGQAAGYERKQELNGSSPFGISGRSRQIEKDLGVR